MSINKTKTQLTIFSKNLGNDKEWNSHESKKEKFSQYTEIWYQVIKKIFYQKSKYKVDLEGLRKYQG